jgi:Spy/CpxP family protein refolding chaperone
MKRERILGALIAGALVISTVAQDDHLQPPMSGSVTAAVPAEKSNIAETTPATDYQTPLTPRDFLKEYEEQMGLVALKTCEGLAQVSQVVGEDQIDPEQAEYLSGQRLELSMIRVQFLDSLHQNLDEKIQKETTQASDVLSSGDTLIVPPPDSSPDVSQAIVKYLELTPVQLVAIQAQIEKERGRVEPLVKRLSKNRRALIAATLKGRFDVRQVRELAAEQSWVEEQFIVANALLQAKVYKILMAEQQRKIYKMKTQTGGTDESTFPRVETRVLAPTQSPFLIGNIEKKSCAMRTRR